MWHHWHRDLEPELAGEALRGASADVLWQAELIHHAHSQGMALHRRMMGRRHVNPGDLEARLVLRWLGRRPRPPQKWRIQIRPAGRP
jgi:hypothetical protein